jgi:hypothetical protein
MPETVVGTATAVEPNIRQAAIVNWQVVLFIISPFLLG